MTGTRYLARILTVDNDPDAQSALRTGLQEHAFSVMDAYSGREGLLLAKDENPNVVLLEMDLPDFPGTELIRRLREWSDVPIIVVATQGEESLKVSAFDSGANDYVTKPYALGELIARIRAAMRSRMQNMGARPVFRTGDIAIDLVQRRVTRNGEEIRLTRREYALLRALVKSAGRVVMHQQLVAEVWGRRITHLDRDYLRIYISRLRRKLELDAFSPRYILTEPGIGYRLQEDLPPPMLAANDASAALTLASD
jgi:two-component system KDP operon response regulator KdpE